jgi:hypothetical protein
MTFNPNSGCSGYSGYGTPQDQALRLAQAQLAEGPQPRLGEWKSSAKLTTV